MIFLAELLSIPSMSLSIYSDASEGNNTFQKEYMDFCSLINMKICALRVYSFYYQNKIPFPRMGSLVKGQVSSNELWPVDLVIGWLDDTEGVIDLMLSHNTTCFRGKQGLPLLITSRKCQSESWQIKLTHCDWWVLGGDDDERYWQGVCVEANNPLFHSLPMDQLLWYVFMCPRRKNDVLTSGTKKVNIRQNAK
jgi:hypothetical protein